MHIEIDKESIPYRFEIELSADLYTLEVHYNERFDFFTVGIEKDDEVIVAGEKMVLDQPLFYSFTDTRLPDELLIPMDEGGNEARITYNNLGTTVLLHIGELVT